MAEISTLARPYAQAVFDLAQQGKTLTQWSDTLKLLASITSDGRMQAAIGNPRLTKAQLSGLLVDVAGAQLSETARNFVGLLVENGRLALLPAIAEQFEALRAEAEATMTAEVTSAFELSATQRSELAAALKKRTGREVTIVSRIDADLLGGAVIRAGDLVIDGSVAGQLTKLAGRLHG
jgi:F-type H+-transporting ATPase subunit delta